MYFDWLNPEAKGGWAAPVETSMYPFPVGVPAHEMEKGAYAFASPTGNSPVVTAPDTYLRRLPLMYPAPELDAVPFSPTMT